MWGCSRTPQPAYQMSTEVYTLCIAVSISPFGKELWSEVVYESLNGTPSAVCPSQRFSTGCSPGLSAVPGQPAPGALSSLRFGAIAPTAGSGSAGFSPGSAAGSSAAAFTRPGRPPLWIALTLGSRWSPRVKTTQLRLTLRDHWRWQMAPLQKVAPGHPPCHAFCICFAICVHFFVFFPSGLPGTFSPCHPAKV